MILSTLILSFLFLIIIYIPTFFIISLFVIKNPKLGNTFKRKPWLNSIPVSVLVSIISLILIHFLSNGDYQSFGLTSLPLDDLLKFSLIGLVLVTFLHIVTHFLRLWKKIPTTSMFKSENSTEKVLITGVMIIFPSIAEELAFRGVIQSFIDIEEYIYFSEYLTFGILVGAFYFGLVHILLSSQGFNKSEVLLIVVSASVLGIFGGIFLQISESIIPAIIVHAEANLVSSIFEEFTPSPKVLIHNAS